MLNLLRRGQLSKWFSGIGQEAVSVGLVAALRSDDWLLPVHRNLAVFTGRGLDLGVLFRQILGRAGGYTGGRDRTFHFGTLDHHVVGMISHLGAMAPVADGLALAARLRGEDRGRRGAGRRRRHQRGRRPRGDEPGGGVAPRRAVRGREQPVGPVDAGERAVRLRRPGRPRRRLRHAGPDRRRQRRRGGARRGGLGGRAGPCGRGPGAARVQDVPDARATRRRRAPTTCPRSSSPPGWRATRSPASRPGSTSRG